MARSISFIIPAHNEELLIARTVCACMDAGRACGHEFEVVVACDSCTDRTMEIALANSARVTHTDKRIIAGARNAGAAVAKGDLFIFVDADTSPPPETVREAIELFIGGAVGGGASVAFDGTIPWRLALGVKFLNWVFRVARYTGGCFLFCTKEALTAAGGWDETMLVGEEISLAQELKKQGRFEIVRTPVVTSGRKLRTYSTWEIAKITAFMAIRPNSRRDRTQLDFWYGPRREDTIKPESAASTDDRHRQSAPGP